MNSSISITIRTMVQDIESSIPFCLNSDFDLSYYDPAELGITPHEFFPERSKIDAETTKCLISKLKSNDISTEERQELIKAAKIFNQKVLKRYWWFERSESLTKESRALDTLLKVAEVAEKMNIPAGMLLTDEASTQIIIKNRLHHVIGKDHYVLGLAPTVIDGKINFPVNYGTPHEPVVDFIPTSKLRYLLEPGKPKDFGPFGFQIGCEGGDEERLMATKLVARDPSTPQNLRNKIRLELVTAAPNYNISSLGLGFFGHTWLRVYVPNKQNTEKNEDYVYSIGFNLKTIPSCDIFEHVPHREHTSNMVSITPDQWNELKTHIEGLREVLRGTREPTSDEKKHLDELLNGTCANFAAGIWEKYAGEKICATYPFLDRILVPQMVLDLMPQSIQRIIRLVNKGFFPGRMVTAQKTLESHCKKPNRYRQVSQITNASKTRSRG